MNRRSLIKLFLALPGLTPALSHAIRGPETVSDFLYQLDNHTPGNHSILNFYLPAREYEWPCFSVGDVFTPRRFRENTRDPNAIALHWYCDMRVDAYVPAPENILIARLLEAGNSLHCRIIEKTGSQRDMPGILFAVYPAGTDTAMPEPAATLEPYSLMNEFKLGMEQEYTLGGFQFHSGEYYWNELSIGDRLNLRRDRYYPQDPHGVAVYWDNDLMIGYIPRPGNAAIAQLLDYGVSLPCRIIEKTESPIYSLGVRISVETAKTINENTTWVT